MAVSSQLNPAGLVSDFEALFAKHKASLNSYGLKLNIKLVLNIKLNIKLVLNILRGVVR